MINLNFSPLQARLWMEKASFAWPDVDVVENESEFVFSFEIPGTAKDDIKIWLEDDILTVSGEKKKPAAAGEDKLIAEREFGKFERSFRLPKAIDKAKVVADFVSGILVIRLPKAIEAQAREISIN